MSFKKTYALLLLPIIGVLQCAAQTNLSFMQQEVAKKAATTEAAFSSLSVSDRQTTRTYVDGFGRPIQTIGVQASPLLFDLIQPVVYDALGRQTKSYLGYAGKSGDTLGKYRANALSAQRSFYDNSLQYTVARDTNAFAQQVYESSPLQRMLKAGTVGTGFQPTGAQHFKAVSYRSNNSTQDGNILLWNTDGTLTASTYYAANTLSVMEGTDEDSTKTISYTDLAGQTVLKRQKLGSGNLDTYYIYNNGGAVKFIVPPKATALLLANPGYTLATTPLSNLVFKYTYDQRGRIISKTVPAKGTSYIVYDPMNRPVLTQDASQAAANKWSYVKYDAKGRPISSGIYVDNTTTPISHIGQLNMQTYVNTLSYTTWYEKRSGTLSNNGYYTNTIFPTTGITPLGYSYYDDYDLNQNGTDDFFYTKQNEATDLPGEGTATTARLKGVSTVTTKAVIAETGSSIASYWLSTATFYDSRLNPIQVRSNNHLYHPGDTVLTDTKTVVPDFTGVPQASKVAKKTGVSTTVTVYTYMTYDHMYRVKDISQKYNAGTKSSVAQYNYNEIGQVVQKNLGYVSAGVWLQNLDMRYNVRGQLLSINNSKLASDTGKTNSDVNDVFGMQMVYDKYDTKLKNRPRYNGRLTAVKWMSKDGGGNLSYERAFRYFYDGIGRDTAAIYAERTTASTADFSITHGWDENRITYDEGGNILTMFRDSTSQNSGGHTPIDNLAYTYDSSNPNRLTFVADASGTAYANSGFRNRTGNSATPYSYDTNGNMTSDPYKGLSSISYNDLNRTEKIIFTGYSNKRYLYYTYDASGQLIRKVQYENVSGTATVVKTTDYLDGFVYEGSTLAYFAMPEGRVLFAGGTFSREYIISDQQGNARVSFNNTGSGGTVKVMQENSYYAYGMIMPGGTVTSGSNKNLYNGGSEWQNDYSNLPDYYQTFYRNYDAALGRWVAVDPLPESAMDMSPYQYAGNNPVMFNDPLGDKVQTEFDNSSSYYPTHRGPLNSNWQNEGAFDDNGPFSSDGGAAGRAFWGTGGGGYTAAWADLLRMVGSDAVNAETALMAGDLSFSTTSKGTYLDYNTLGTISTVGFTNNFGNYTRQAQEIIPHHVLLNGANAGGDLFNQQPKKTTFESGLLNVLNRTSVGSEISSDDLVKKYGIPSNAASLINSLTKKSNNTIAVDWVSGWKPIMILVKSVSDAVFKDGTLNMRQLGNGALGLSGDAIGIKYNGTTYYNLILNGNTVTVPGIPNRYWTIGTSK